MQSRPARHAPDDRGGTRQISNETLRWAQQAFERDVAELLDDPAYVLADAPGSFGLTFADGLETYRRVAADLGLDFDQLSARVGTPLQVQRLNDLSAGG